MFLSRWCGNEEVAARFLPQARTPDAVASSSSLFSLCCSSLLYPDPAWGELSYWAGHLYSYWFIGALYII